MIKRISYLFFQAALVLVMTVGNTAVFAQQEDKAAEGQDPDKTVGIVAHRGFHKYDGSAENTVSAMVNAIDHDFYGTEFDMQVTGDDVAIVFHDDMLEGIPIQEVPYSEIMNYPASTLSNGESIPMLKNFMEAYAKALDAQQLRGATTRLFFEIKTPHNADKVDLAAAIAYEAVTQHQLEKNVCFISFSLAVCKAMAGLMPNADIAYLGGDIPPRQLKEMGINAIDYHFKVLIEHPEWIKEAHLLGMRVIAWTVNDEKIAHRLKDMGVDLITTDLPLDMTDWVDNDTTK